MLSKEQLKKARLQYLHQSYQAKKRNVSWEIGFDEWLNWWISTGHYHERGRKSHEYCMSRYNDTGPYKIGNIFCQTVAQNTRDAHLGVRKSEDVKKKISDSLKGHSVSDEVKMKLKECNLGKKVSEETLNKRKRTVSEYSAEKRLEIESKKKKTRMNNGTVLHLNFTKGMPPAEVTA